MVVLLLAACGEAPSPGNDAAAAPPPRAAPFKPFVAEEKSPLIEFRYGWSAEAAAVPGLVERFRAEMDKLKRELEAGAEKDRRFREREGIEFHGHMASIDHRTAGQSDRLLSLVTERSSFTGGAHGAFNVGTILWDRATGQEIGPAELFAAADNMDRLLTQRWCDALNIAREEKRGQPAGEGGIFDDCPALGDIAVIPADGDGNRRFEKLLLIASPYVAGPWAEGSYEIELGVTPELLAGLREEYRGGFELPQTQ